LSRSFLALLATQFQGAMTDNLFRWLAVPIAKPILGDAKALSLGLMSFTLPYLLLAAPAGFLADRFSKRQVIIGCKIAEIVLMLLGIIAIISGSLYLMFSIVFLMGCHSALFSPSKFGSIPEQVPGDKISHANGWMGLITVLSSAVGTVAGNWLYTMVPFDADGRTTFTALLPASAALVGVAVAGWLVSLMITKLPAADAARPLPPNPITETWRNLRLLSANVVLLRTALGMAFFWFLASLANMNIDTFGNHELDLTQKDIGPLLGIIVLGVAIGSVLAGVWSRGRVELGIVPLGAVGISISALLLYLTGESIDPNVTATTKHAYGWSCVWLFTLGISAGLFNVPLESFLQHRSEVRTRGVILAASNFVSFSLMLLSGLLFWFLRDVLQLSASSIFLAAGLGTIPVVFYVVRLLPDATIRFLVWIVSATLYRVKVRGRENLPATGGALLVANHVSWLDGILLLLTSSRPIRMLAYSDYVSGWWIRRIAQLFGVIPIKATDGPKGLLRSLQTAREAIEEGELVCIFAEGSITRTGQLQPFQRGLLRIVQGTGAPVVPIYLDGLWGSIFSYSGGKFLWKRPQRWPYPVSISFGAPLSDPDNVNQVREAVQKLGVESVQERKDRQMLPPRQLLRQLRKSRFRSKVADSSGAELTGGKLLTAILVFKRLLERKVFAADERMVGILLPPSVGGAIANGAVSLLKRVSVNLNYTLSERDVNYCIEQSGIRHVLTSRKFLEKRPYNLNAKLVFLEDLKEEISSFDKAVALLQAFVAPVVLIERMMGLTSIKPDDLMTVIFTSGSTGNPKGVMLSHYNIATNIEAADQLIHFARTDVLLGILPFFHSFGFTFPLWLTLTADPKSVYHFNPADPRMIGKLCKDHGVTIMAATPTFLKRYLKRCDKEQFATLDTAILGAEKMPLDLAREFEEKFGVWPTEGYGTTELSPLAACNIPPHRSPEGHRTGTRNGTVGRPVPNVSAKVVDPETGEDLGLNTEGLLWIKGPNVMLGYLNQPEKTAEVIRDGWYNTGDFAKIDDDGFIQITGRQSRFSKIGGEMVPHLRIEELLSTIVEDPNDEEGEIRVAVTAVPDEDKGERLIVVHKALQKPVDEVLKELAASHIPNLWLPSRDSFLEVESIPLL
ncbi:MAG: acyl-[ACP]--phospholipid O-acyltransferase, partial [Planctomycetaceae bacterium]